MDFKLLLTNYLTLNPFKIILSFIFFIPEAILGN